MIDFSAKKYFILDLDGTLYAGSQLFSYTVGFLRILRQSGRKPVFMTNNSSKSTDEYFDKLKKLGIAENIEEIYTSGKATIEFLAAKEIKRIFLMAPPAVEKEFEEAGFELVDSGEPQAVVLAFDTTFTYKKFCRAHELITAGVPFYATHPDTHLPLENNKFHPDIGTLISAIHTSTGKKPVVIGKPEKPIYKQLQAHLDCKVSEMVMVGDRLYTDIRGANDYGIDTVLVMSGETTREMHQRAVKEVDGKTGTGQSPTVVMENVGALNKYLTK